jgi:hypothetical protein
MKKGSQGVFWFSSNKGSIEGGKSGAQGTKKIMPLFADIKNPAGWKEYDKYSIGELEGLGYDGVILKNKDGSFDGFILNNTQIKSAPKNTGAFSSRNPDIRGSGAVPIMAGTAAAGAGIGALIASQRKNHGQTH